MKNRKVLESQKIVHLLYTIFALACAKKQIFLGFARQRGTIFKFQEEKFYSSKIMGGVVQLESPLCVRA